LPAGPGESAAGIAPAAQQDEAFQKIAKEYVEDLLRMHPEYATELGDHRYDGQLTDYAPEMRARALVSDRQFLKKLEAFTDTSKLTGANQVDVRILLQSLLKRGVAARIFGIYSYGCAAVDQRLGSALHPRTVEHARVIVVDQPAALRQRRRCQQ
jgi:hypothetical protein